MYPVDMVSYIIDKITHNLRIFMRLLKLLLLVSLFSAGAAHAQFGNLLNDLKSAVVGVSQNKKAEQSQSQPTKENSVPATTPATQKTAPKGPPPTSREIAFQCKVNGKELMYGNNLDSDDPNIYVRMANVNAKPLLMDYDWRSEAKDPLYLTEEAGNRVSVTTVYFKVKQMTYGISFCEGMMCGNPNQPYSFAIFNGDKKVKQEFCDEDTASEFNFPVKADKNGKLSSQLKSVIVLKKSPLKFDPFN